jgi:hypothetical protein
MRFSGSRIPTALVLAAAAVSAILIAGCLKSGTGVGLTDRGEPIAIDPCAANPSAAGCTIDSCSLSPKPAGCAIDSCSLTPKPVGCPVDSCSLTPKPAGCTAVDPCIANPNLPQCPTAGPDCGKVPKPAECLEKEYFTRNVAPIFKENCEECHKPSGQAWASTKLSLETATGWDSLVNVPSKEMTGKVVMRVRPGNPDSSYLYWKITRPTPPVGSRMPLGKPALTTEQLETIRVWIVGKN